jgi:EAL and modified HD-GYP domain-containing signal transduction protein
MKPSSVLDQVVLGYSPVYDRQRAVAATRLTVFPVRGDSPPEGASLLDALAEAFGAEAPAAAALPAVWLNIADEPLLDAVLQACAGAPRAVLVEVPAFLAPPRAAALQSLADVGQPLALRGLPRDPSVAGLSAFACLVLDLQDEEQRAAVRRGALSHRVVAAGARLAADVDAALAGAATAVAGWPVDDEPAAAPRGGMPPEVRGIVELMNCIEREDPVERMEAVLTGDPALGFRLLRYLNSAAFGLRAEVTSFRHGLKMLGHQRLKRWLALLLATGSPNPLARLINPVAARRGLVLDELARRSGDDWLRSEMFIGGVFSLLDRLMGLPMEALMRDLPVPPRVQQSLLGSGPYAQHLALVQALEAGSAADIAEACEAALASRGDVNRALLRALSLARELD